MLDYGLNLENDKFEISDNIALFILHLQLVTISLANIGIANNIFLVVYGYANNKLKQDEMDKMFKKYKKVMHN